MRLLTLLAFFLCLFFAVGNLEAQTTLIPVADGNFSNGPTFAANGWSVSNGTNQPWFVGSPSNIPAAPFSGNCAYVSSDGGASVSYIITNPCQNYFWRDITVPAGETVIRLRFDWNQQGESSWDIVQVFVAPTSITPVGSNSHPGSGISNVPAAITGATYVANTQLAAGNQVMDVALPTNLAGTTFRLIFVWKSDISTGTQPPASIDNITLTSRAPGNFTSVASGNWSDPATWGSSTSFPTILDNATVATGHTVTVDLNTPNFGASNLSISGTVTFNTTATALTIGENLTVNSGGTLNMFNGTTGKRLNVAGNITNNGTIDLSVGGLSTGTGTNGVLSFTGAGVQTIGGSGTWTANSIRNVQMNNTSTVSPNITWNVNNLVILNSLNLTGARVSLGTNALLLGNSANTGPTFTAPVGTGFTSGTFGRWWTNSATGVAISASADPAAAAATTTVGHYPFVAVSGPNVSDRSFWINRSSSTTTGNTAGYLNVAYTDGTGLSTITPVADGSYSINRQFNGSWTVSATGGYAYASGTHKVATKANNAYFPTTANSRLMRISSVIGTHEAGTATPGAHRTTLSTAQLTGAAWYMGINDTELPITTIANGPWNSGSTWSSGTPPTCNDFVVVAHQVTIATTGNVTRGVIVAAGGQLTMTSGDLLVDACTPRADAHFDIGQGIFNMQGGTLTVRGRFRTLDFLTGQFIQSGGDIIVDGNNGVAAESVTSHIVDFYCNNASHLQLTGGDFTVVDPPASTTTTNCAFKVFPAAGGNFSSGVDWKLNLGTGSTTNNGGHSNGYLVNLTNGSTSFKIGGTFLINTTAGGTNRHASSTSNIPLHTLRVISGEYRLASVHYISGNLINGGALVASSTIHFADWNGSAGVVGSNASMITGSGTFNNLTSSPTANLTSMVVNTTGGLTLDVPISLSGTLTLTKGIITTSSTNWLRLGTATANGTLSGTPADDTHINGPFRRTFGSSTATNTFSNTHIFPTGKGGVYRPIWISPTAGTGGTIFSAEAFLTNSGSAGSGVSNLSTDTWEVSVLQNNGLTQIHTQLGSPSITSTRQILQAPSATGAYNGIATGTAYTAGTPNTLRTNPNASPLQHPAQWTGFLAYGDLTPCGVPSAQPTALVFSQVGSNSLQLNYTAASTTPDGYLVVRYPSAAPTITDPVNATVYAVGAALGAGTVVAVGAQLQVGQSGLTASTDYTYVIYSYNGVGCGGGPIYLTTSPLQGTVTTCATTVAAPTGFVATARSMTTMTYTWAGSAPSYELDVATDPAYTSFVTGYNAKTVTTPPELITGLTPGTTYYLRIRALDGGCYSTNTTATNGTLCSGTPTPMIENLNSALTCLSVINVSGGNNWTVGAAPTTPSGMTGNTARITSSTTTATNAYFVTRAVGLTSGTYYDLKFKVGNSSGTGTLNLEVLYNLAGTNGTIVTAGATQIINLPLVANTASNTVTASFAPSSTGDYYILFRANNGTVTTTSTLHLDDIEVSETPQCSAASGGTITSSLTGSACGNTNTTVLNASGYSLGLNMTYQWQKSTDNINWSNMGAAINHPAQPSAPFTSDAFVPGNNYYRLQATCNNGPIVGNSNVIGPIAYSNPTIATTTPGSRCGVGTVTLGATATNSSATLYWYANATGGAPLGSGTTFTTPTISATTDFYVAAAEGGTIFSAGLPDNTGAYGTYGSPGSTDYGLGFTTTSPLNIVSAYVYPISAGSCTFQLQDNNGTLIPGQTVTVTFGAGDVAVKTLVSLNFAVPAAGTYRIKNTAGVPLGRFNPYTGPAYPLSYGGGAFVINNAWLGSTNSLTTYYSFFDMLISTACEGTRTAVTATVTTPPSITAAATPTTICNGGSSVISATSSNSGYSYTWAPGALSGASHSVSPTTLGANIYSVTATDMSGGPHHGCATTAQVTVQVNPTPVAPTITPASDPTICVNTVQSLSAPLPSGLLQVGTGTATTSVTGITPYSSNFEGNRTQYLYTASELYALGFAPGVISGLQWNVTAIGAGTFAQSGFTIKMGHTTATAFAGAFLTPTAAFTTVYGPVSLPAPAATGWNNFNFSSNFTWDGTSNILIDICHDNDPSNSCASCFSSNSSVQASTTTFNSVYGRYNDNAAACNTNASSAITTFTTRPNIRFNFTPSATMTWSPVTDLFTDAAATVPYVAGAHANTVYAKPAATTTYTATVTNTFGCTNTASRTVNIDKGAGTITGSATVCAGSTTTLTTDGATGGTWASSNTSVATVSSTGVVTGVAAGTADITYTVTTTACGTTTATHTVTVTNCASILTLTQTFIEGYMNGTTMRPVLENSGVAGATSAQCDTITVALHAATAPHAQVYSEKVVLGITGAATVTFPAGANGNSYYIVIKGRNIIETWSANPVAFTSTASYNFGSAGQAYGSNLGSVGGTAVIYSGDINQDEEVSPADFSIWSVSNAAGAVGYEPADLDGDGEVLPADFSIWSVNNSAGILVQKP